MTFNWRRYASPPHCYRLISRILPALWAISLLLGVAGLLTGLLLAPGDVQQGEGYRIIFIHVPASWMSMIIYLAIALWAAVGLVLNTSLSFMLMTALAPTGAAMTALSLLSGALWGKPMWGAWWVWDARLTSELILLFLYLALLALRAAIDDPRRADRACALFALFSVINIPIIYFSVRWWNTLHQGPSITMGQAPAMSDQVLLGLVLMTLAAWAYSLAMSFSRLRLLILQRQADTGWVKQLTGACR
ncbi:heme ABC transporter permease CcmC [Aquitalea aquatica]|uniref:Heme exporter protein C n=1 Tax=Aquitalea aquatica TaxID=3044273 RepID=A0A838YHT2_9NEIS|nr:heme ABC transporter permease CcmC [Aquitalea magnusonii]MBA4710141.1 cytochrome c biogenesis protein CcsA [Aquitalea magnusonii]